MLTLALALGIRLVGIASRPIWYDEAFSILISDAGPSAILSGTLGTNADSSAAEEHPPAYYFMLWAWMKVFNNSLVSARLLSVLAGIGVVAAAHLIARRLFDGHVAGLAGLLTATLPFQVHYAQEMRMYVFLALWLTLATYAFLRRQWMLFAASAALAQYTHNLAAIYLISLALTPVFQRDWKTLRALTLAGLAAIALYSPWLIHLPAQLAKIQGNFWLQRPGSERLLTLFLYYLPNLPLPPSWLPGGLLLATLTVALAAYQTFRAAKQRRPEATPGLWLAHLSFSPPILLWLLSQIQPIYLERALLPSHVIFCIWLAWALAKTNMPRRVRRMAFAFVIAAAAMGLYQHIAYKGFPYGPYAALDRSLRARLKAGEVILHSSKLSYLPAFYFDRELPQAFIADPAGSETDTLSTVTRQILGLNAAQDVKSASEGASRVWFIIFQRSIEEFTTNGYETHPHLEYLGENFALESVEEWDDLRLYLYARRAP